jgi:hypothetical protein
MHTCLNCGSSENEIPLVNLTFAGQPAFICSRCLPVLIHNPAQLKDKLPGAEKITPVSHKD